MSGTRQTSCQKLIAESNIESLRRLRLGSDLQAQNLQASLRFRRRTAFKSPQQRVAEAHWKSLQTLCKLPREIRDMIYAHVVDSMDFTDYYSLVRTNRQIYEELTGHLFRTQQFVLVVISAKFQVDLESIRLTIPEAICSGFSQDRQSLGSALPHSLEVHIGRPTPKPQLVLLPGLQAWRDFASEFMKSSYGTENLTEPRTAEISVTLCRPQIVEVEHKLLSVLEQSWWDIPRFTIHQARDEGYASRVAAGVRSSEKWITPEAFLAELQSCLDCGDHHYSKGSRNRALAAWKRGMELIYLIASTTEGITWVIGPALDHEFHDVVKTLQCNIIKASSLEVQTGRLKRAYQDYALEYIWNLFLISHNRGNQSLIVRFWHLTQRFHLETYLEPEYMQMRRHVPGRLLQRAYNILCRIQEEPTLSDVDRLPTRLERSAARAYHHEDCFRRFRDLLEEYGRSQEDVPDRLEIFDE